MKKKLFLLMALFILFACETEELKWVIKEYTVNSNQWELMNGANQLNSFYRAELKIPDLDRYVYENGNVFCYMYQTVDGVEVQTLLPFTIPYGERLGNGYESLWTETISCDFTIGSVMIYVNYSDFNTSNKPPTASFRVVLNY